MPFLNVLFYVMLARKSGNMNLDWRKRDEFPDIYLPELANQMCAIV